MMCLARLECPRCHGQPNSTAFVHTSTGCSLRAVTCSFCDGIGTVTEQQDQLHREGQERRDDRVLRGLSLREEAKRLGIKPTELAAIERGKPSAPEVE